MSDFIIGLDLGQVQDYTALTIIEKVYPPDEEHLYHLRHIERFPLHTSYPDVVDKVKEYLKSFQTYDSVYLVIDSTGVGLGIMDMFIIEYLYPIGITITGGTEINRDGDNYKVPKRDLVTCLQILFQTERLKIAKNLRHVDTLIQEFSNFRVKITTKGNDTYEAWREGQHDDLVLSVALACWYGENTHPCFMIMEEPLVEGVFEF